MSNSKTLAEYALRCLNVIKDLPVHEKVAVFGLINTLLLAEAKNADLAQAQRERTQLQQPPLSFAAPADEHYEQ
jgi:hypothetical protein